MMAITPMPVLAPQVESLGPFVAAGLLHEAEVQVAAAVARTVAGTAHEVLLATALCVRALQLGHTCIEIYQVADTVGVDTATPGDHPPTGEMPAGPIAGLQWPDPFVWAAILTSSEAVAVRDPSTGESIDPLANTLLRPLVFDGSRVYLERYWRYERYVGDCLLSYATRSASSGAHGDVVALGDDAAVEAALDRFFGPDGATEPNLQRRGAEAALRGRVTFLAGGPGTGKTHTVARLLAAIRQLGLDSGRSVEVALVAPTGKAAARMSEAVRQAATGADLPPALGELLLTTGAQTIHRLLGYIDGVTFRHNRANPLRHDVVVIDETSMVDLPLMAHLLEALRPETRLVLVGDPFQLASVEAGAVLGDVVGPAARSTDRITGPLADNIVVLQRVHRFAAGSAIAEVADAVQARDADRAVEVLRGRSDSEVEWLDPADIDRLRRLRHDVVANAGGVVRAARAGDARLALERSVGLKVLCGTRFGALGSYAWRDYIEAGLTASVADFQFGRRWYIGRPVIITANNYRTGLFNGDTGIVIAGRAKVDGSREGGAAVKGEVNEERPVVALADRSGIRSVPPALLGAVETWWAMTIPKSQGSEFDHAVVCLPEIGSRILTNELLYTAITRAKCRVTVVASEAALRFAVENPVARASGLQARLWPRQRPYISSSND